MSGGLDAMVTAPICKEGFHKAGIDVPGHTEMLADLTGTKRFAMMLFGGPLRVVLVTRHLPIKDVSKHLTRRRVLEAISIAGEALPWMGWKKPSIGVCGLNPHAGDGGEIGREEIAVIAPAIRDARALGFNAIGPVPADAIFHKAFKGEFGAVVAMYHDQGLGPMKMIAFDSGVNITLGLPIVRTSPDHGTAFDIAGKGIANPASMIQALLWARKLARRKNPWVQG
jgi:4-hydroxythreonine-4-phosphate dehydrogenase